MSTATLTPAPRTSTVPKAAEVARKPMPLVRHSLALAKRSLIKTWRTPEALIDVTLQPAIFLVIFVYIFGGAVAGDTHTYLQFLLPGILAQTIAQGSIAIGVTELSLHLPSLDEVFFSLTGRTASEDDTAETKEVA